MLDKNIMSKFSDPSSSFFSPLRLDHWASFSQEQDESVEEENGTGYVQEEDEDEENITEIRFVPSDKSLLNPLFQAMNHCQALYPDEMSADEDDGELEGEEDLNDTEDEEDEDDDVVIGSTSKNQANVMRHHGKKSSTKYPIKRPNPAQVSGSSSNSSSANSSSMKILGKIYS